MTCYSDNQMAAALRLAGVSAGDAAVLVATSHPESGGCNVVQQGQPYATTGWGVWQITPGNSEPQFGINNALLSLIPNSLAAAAKLRSQGLGAWTTVTDGLYRPYLPAAQTAVAQVYHMSQQQVSQLAHSAASGGSGGSTGIGTTGFNPLGSIGGDIFGNLLNDLAKSFGAGSVKDMWIRAGFIIFGALLVLVGIAVMVAPAAKGVAQSPIGSAAIEAVAPESAALSLGSPQSQRLATSRSRARSERTRAEAAKSRAATQAAREQRIGSKSP